MSHMKGHYRGPSQQTVRLLAALFLASCSASTTSSDLQLGERPAELIDALDEGPLKNSLQQCDSGPFNSTTFSIGHRGAPLQYPEHTRESYEAAASMGAGLVECDVTFTQDRELVCRHSQCDLHSTTDILSKPALAAKCSNPFEPAVLDATTGDVVTPASVQCCTSDISLAEFKTLRGTQDNHDPAARVVDQYNEYSSTGTLMTHAESIELFKTLGVGMIPELKEALVPMPFDGSYTQAMYAQQLVDEYKAAGVTADDVWIQSFDLQDIDYWINQEPAFGKQVAWLDGRYRDPLFQIDQPSSWRPGMVELASRGVRVLASPLWMLVTLDENQAIVPSNYALQAREAGLDLVAWTLERSGSLATGGGWYYQSIQEVIDDDSDMLVLLDVLAQQVGVRGVFSDWPAAVTYYANCLLSD